MWATFPTYAHKPMNKYELIELLSSSDENEVYIETGENEISDFSVEHLEEQFDGFATFYPAAIVLKPNNN